MTRKIIKREMRQGADGEIYQFTHFEETVEHEDDEITRSCFRIMRTPYKADQEVEVTDATKFLIEKIAKGEFK
jgi:hypothetical protein